MKKIRYGVFETNSSSTHVISLSSKSPSKFMDNSLVPDDNGNVVLNGGQFGWGPERHSNAQKKASYVAVYLEMIKDECCCIGDIHGRKKLFIDVIKEQTGCRGVIFNFSLKYDKLNWSYIDHQSFIWEHDICGKSGIFEDAEKMRNFIFNKKSILVIDSDNH